jgi:hypothetical protein
MQYSFGSGVLYGRSLTSNTPTPVRFGALQDVSVDFQFNQKELYGSKQFPIAIGRGTGKIAGKANFAQFNAQTFNDLFFGLSNPSTGSVRTAVEEAQTVTANQVTATNGANFVADMGVVLASDHSVYTRVAASPVGQQYTCNETTGVYTFNNSQNAAAVLISYTYNDGANGKKINITNQLLGASPQFMVVLTESFTKGSSTKKLTMVLNACMSSKLTLATKLEDFTIPAFEFQAFADDSDNIGSFSLDE